MLNNISRAFSSSSKDLGLGFGDREENTLPVFEKIDKHLSVLSYRNSQLRNAILAKSEEYVAKRRKQFITVLKSYVHLIITDLHQSIAEGSKFDKNSRYSLTREQTFSGYEEILKRINQPSSEMLRQGPDFARELFNIELQLREYQELEEEYIYPLYILAHDSGRGRGLLRRVLN